MNIVLFGFLFSIGFISGCKIISVICDIIEKVLIKIKRKRNKPSDLNFG